MFAECLLLSLTLCRGVRDPAVLTLTAIHTTTAVVDGITTMQKVDSGGHEANPVSRAVLGRTPSWSRMLPAGAVEVLATMYISERMHTSRHKLIRTLWWLPASLAVAGHGAGITYTLRH